MPDTMTDDLHKPPRFDPYATHDGTELSCRATGMATRGRTEPPPSWGLGGHREVMEAGSGACLREE
jgi:hypothetical protein